MVRQRVTLFVYGLTTYLGREVARFGRAMGHRIVAIGPGPMPAVDEPWMHGIQWNLGGQAIDLEDVEERPAAILYCSTALWSGEGGRFERIIVDGPRQLVEAAAQLPHPPRFVLRSTTRQHFLASGFTAHHRRAEQVVARSGLDFVILRLPLLYGPDRPDSVAAMMVGRVLDRVPLSFVSRRAPRTMRVETAALAALRAALEPDIAGILEPQEVARIGDVMIPQ